MTNNVDHSLWLRRGLVTWSLVLCNTVFCCRIFLSELWESGGTGPQRGRAASTKLIINVSSGLLGEAAEPQGQCEKWQIKGSTVWLFLCSSQVSSPLASKLTDISFHKAMRWATRPQQVKFCSLITEDRETDGKGDRREERAEREGRKGNWGDTKGVSLDVMGWWKKRGSELRT